MYTAEPSFGRGRVRSGIVQKKICRKVTSEIISIYQGEEE